MGILSQKYGRLRLTKVERGGFFTLFIVLSVLLIIESRRPEPSHGLIELDAKEVLTWRSHYDSITKANAQNKQRIFPFNPNFISPAKADRIGLSATEFKRFQDFRQGGNWINAAEHFQQITGVSNNWLQQFSPLFKFPDFSKNQSRTRTKALEKISFSQAQAQHLIRVKGIGPVLAQRIIRARDKWGGIGSQQELMMVYGITPALKEALMHSFLFDKKSVIQRNINVLYPSDLAEIPGINFSMAKTIWEFVRLRQGLNNLEELQLLDEIQPRLFEVIQLYLYAMKNEP